MIDADDELYSKLFAELYLVSTEENELKASPVFYGLILIDEVLPLLIEEDLAF